MDRVAPDKSFFPKRFPHLLYWDDTMGGIILVLDFENKKKIRAEQATIKRRMLKKQKIAHCEYCGNKTKEILQIHHIEAISDGGSNDLNNVIILCPNCHKSAHAGIIKKEDLHKLKISPKTLKDFQYNYILQENKIIMEKIDSYMSVLNQTNKKPVNEKNKNIIEQLNSYIFRLEQKNEFYQKEILRLQMQNQKIKNSKIFTIMQKEAQNGDKEKYNLFYNLFGFKFFIKV